ncbi:DUF2459 domain-containing protein [Pleurocapsales cyanobacterium LEGE 06147]|nr:DUF2459 domain-containing protein [Pleurocapsales cyanobacterium LEGE 06147]
MGLYLRSYLCSRSLKIILLSISALVVVVFVLAYSPTWIVPPTAPIAPITVYVTDYGYHGRLVLPSRQGGLVQYAYGDWDYFALERQNWNKAIAALLIPTQGTLGRRRIKDFAELRQILGPDWQDILLSFEVATSKAFHLEESLDVRFDRNIDTRVFNPHNGLTFVKDEWDYTLLHNSNHELVEWLEDLDCRVKGFPTLPNFQIQEVQP